MSKIDQIKIPITTETVNWELVRERDGLTKRSADVIWIEWTDEGRFKAKHTEPAIGRSLLMSPFNDFFTWQTTAVTEIEIQRPDYVKFKTTNSNYILSWIYAEATGNPI